MSKTIPLTKGYSAIVDDEDYDRLSIYKWRAGVQTHPSGTKAVYAYTNIRRPGKPRAVPMHRFILGFPDSLVDHADRDGLNNQKNNLRKGTYSQNNANRKSYKGQSVWKGISKGKWGNWRARIYCNRKSHSISCKEEVDAATAYNFMAYELFGEFACYNVPVNS